MHGPELVAHAHQQETTLRAVYRERRDVMLAAMERYFPDEVTWTRPEGGLFLWATLPDRCDATAVLQTDLTVVAQLTTIQLPRGQFRLTALVSTPQRDTVKDYFELPFVQVI